MKQSLPIMRFLAFSLVFFAGSFLGFWQSGKSEDVFVSEEMLQEFQERIFDTMDKEMREFQDRVFDRMDKLEQEVKGRFASNADKVFELFNN